MSQRAKLYAASRCGSICRSNSWLAGLLSKVSVRVSTLARLLTRSSYSPDGPDILLIEPGRIGHHRRGQPPLRRSEKRHHFTGVHAGSFVAKASRPWGAAWYGPSQLVAMLLIP